MTWSFPIFTISDLIMLGLEFGKPGSTWRRDETHAHTHTLKREGSFWW